MGERRGRRREGWKEGGGFGWGEKITLNFLSCLYFLNLFQAVQCAVSQLFDVVLWSSSLSFFQGSGLWQRKTGTEMVLPKLSLLPLYAFGFFPPSIPTNTHQQGGCLESQLGCIRRVAPFQGTPVDLESWIWVERWIWVWTGFVHSSCSDHNCILNVIYRCIHSLYELEMFDQWWKWVYWIRSNTRLLVDAWNQG